MNIGIVTIIDNNNYGNRLQNYAVQEILKGLNFNVLTLSNSVRTNYYSRFLLRSIKELFFPISTFDEDIDRKSNFCDFNKHISLSKKKYNVFSNFNYFDYLIVGSDQVWNPNYRLSDFDLLKFNNYKGKKIAFSASFGVSSLSSENNGKVFKCLSDFNFISVRETAGKDILDSLKFNKPVEVLIDPTMLISVDKWLDIAKKPSNINNDEKYILNYFLGDLSDERYDIIKHFAEKNNCRIINILDKNDPFYCSGPSEFLWLEKNAFLICTDSFHSSVFAFLFDRPFIIFEREQVGVENMGSRLDTFLNKFELNNRRFNGKKITLENLNHDYSEAYKILEEEKLKSKKFLFDALDVKESE